MSIVLLGSTSGSVTLQEQAVSGNTVLSLPAVTGTVLTDTSPKAGNVIQVVSTTPDIAQVSTTSTSYVTSNLSLAITPTSSSSKIFVICSYSASANNGRSCATTLYRNSTNLAPDNALGRFYTASGGDSWSQGSIMFLDSPATTSSTTYVLYFRAEGSYTVDLFAGSFVAPTLTLMEIAA